MFLQEALLTIRFRSAHRNEVLAFARRAGETLLHQYVARHAVTSEMPCGCTVGRCDPNETSARGQSSSDLVEGVPYLASIPGLVALDVQADIKRTVPTSAVLETTSSCRGPARRADAPTKRRQRAA